jgi:hypothetical protein
MDCLWVAHKTQAMMRMQLFSSLLTQLHAILLGLIYGAFNITFLLQQKYYTSPPTNSIHPKAPKQLREATSKPFTFTFQE